MSPAHPDPRPNLTTVSWAVIWNQMLWTAGYTLTSGGFLTYFAAELGAKAFTISLLLVVPETVGIAALLARPLIARWGSRKRVWLLGTVFSRLLLLTFVSLGVSRHFDEQTTLAIMIGVLAIASAMQSVAYVSYVSWLSDLAPEGAWGKFFARENIAKVVVTAFVPMLAGYLRDWWKGFAPEYALFAYVAAFLTGTVLMIASTLPMRRLPDMPLRASTFRLPEGRLLRRSWRRPSLRYLLIHNWWLAAANGLTQAAFFGYMFGTLNLGLGNYYTLAAVMNLLMVPVSVIAGRYCDRVGNKRPLFWGVLVASSAMPFWMLATREHWQWLILAHALWSGFAAANIAGRNLLLKLASRGDNTAELTLFRNVGGLIAGFSGLLGGLWLQTLQDSSFGGSFGEFAFGPFHVLFLVSWIGRMTSLVWLLEVREPTRADA